MYKRLFKQTAIYGLATVVPRMLSFLLVGLYTELLPRAEYGEVSVLFAWMVFFNVVLSYGMETAFFRFFNTEENQDQVVSTATTSIFWTSMAFLCLALLFRNTIAGWTNIDAQYITLSIWILVLDALVIVPFSRLRALQKPLYYTCIKIGNVAVNLSLNLFFLLALPGLAANQSGDFFSSLYSPNYEVGYIFVSNLIASLLTFLVLAPDYFRYSWHFNGKLWKRMISYGLPILIAGIAFAINEHFDKILLEKLLPPNIAKSETGIYSACYKIALFMTLFATAFRLGIEPFFFSHASNSGAKETYASITKYFVIFGSVILLTVIVFADIIKLALLRDESYWAGMKVVPLIVLANLFLGIYANLSVWYKLIDKTRIGAYISILGAAITLVLNFLLIPKMSYYGSAIATLAAYGSMMLVSWHLGRKHYPIPYDLKRILSYLGVSTAFSAIYFYGFREKYYIGIPLLLLFLLMVYLGEKQSLQRILKKGRS